MRFYDEARKLLDNEQGRPSLTTAQALLFLFVYNSASATDRAGSFFRFAGCEMFKRLRLGANSVRFGDTDIDRDQYRAARARNAWGMFFVEKYVDP